MKSPHPSQKFLKRLGLTLAAAGLALALTLAALWHRGSLQSWINAKVASYYVTEIQPHLPFVIEAADFDGSLWDALHGRFKNISISVRYENWRARLSGPVRVTRDAARDFDIQWNTLTTLESIDHSDQRSDPLGLELHARINSRLNQAQSFEARARAKNWNWRAKKISLAENELQVAWHAPEKEVRWSLTPLSLSGVARALPLPAGLSIRGGTIALQGTLLAEEQLLRGTARIRDGAFQHKPWAFAGREITADLRFDFPKQVQGKVEAQEIYFKKAKAKLDPTRVTLTSLGKDLFSNKGARLFAASEKDPKKLPLEIEGVSAHFGPIESQILGQSDDLPHLETSIRLDRTPFDKLAQPFCLNAKLPPAEIEAELAELELGPDRIEPDGRVTIHLFDGTVRLSELGFFDLNTEAPETDFNLAWDGVSLEKLCAWAGFGSVIGTLEGFARDVTFQGWLPTHFDFSLDAKPTRSRATIELDPEAMYNLVSLFAGDALAHVPVVAHEGVFNRIFDPYFGWLSKRIGGFDLRYLGLSLYSDGGTILLETHDPPAIYQRLKKHHVFWGHRFSMPIQSPHYPVVMDTTGMARIFQYMIKRAELIAQTKRGTTLTSSQASGPCLPPDF